MFVAATIPPTTAWQATASTASSETLKRSGRTRAVPMRVQRNPRSGADAAYRGEPVHEDHSVVPAEPGPDLTIAERPAPAPVLGLSVLDVGAGVGDDVDDDHACPEEDLERGGAGGF